MESTKWNELEHPRDDKGRFIERESHDTPIGRVAIESTEPEKSRSPFEGMGPGFVDLPWFNQAGRITVNGRSWVDNKEVGSAPEDVIEAMKKSLASELKKILRNANLKGQAIEEGSVEVDLGTGGKESVPWRLEHDGNGSVRAVAGQFHDDRGLTKKQAKKGIARALSEYLQENWGQFINDNTVANAKTHPDLFKPFVDALKTQFQAMSTNETIVERYAATFTELFSEHYAVRKKALKSGKGQQEFQWITVKPNGPDAPGQPVMIDKRDGTVKAGMGGKFDGQKIGEIGKGKGGDSSSEAKPKPEEFGYFQGNKGRKTGKVETIHGGEFEEIEMLEGQDKGKMKMIPTQKQSDETAKKAQDDWKTQQSQFSKLKKSQKTNQPGTLEQSPEPPEGMLRNEGDKIAHPKNYWAHIGDVGRLLDGGGYYREPEGKPKPMTAKQMASEFDASTRFGDGLRNLLDKTGYFTDGRFFVDATSQKQEILSGKLFDSNAQTPNFADILEGHKKAKPAKPVAYSSGNLTNEVVLEIEDGGHVHMNQKFYDTIRKLHGNSVQWHGTDSESTVYAKIGNRVVGGAMPMSGGKRFDPSMIGDKRTDISALPLERGDFSARVDSPKRERGKQVSTVVFQSPKTDKAAFAHAEKGGDGWTLFTGLPNGKARTLHRIAGPFKTQSAMKEAVEKLSRHITSINEDGLPVFTESKGKSIVVKPQNDPVAEPKNQPQSPRELLKSGNEQLEKLGDQLNPLWESKYKLENEIKSIRSEPSSVERNRKESGARRRLANLDAKIKPLESQHSAVRESNLQHIAAIRAEEARKSEPQPSQQPAVQFDALKNENAKAGDQLGMFGEATRAPRKQADFSGRKPKAKQANLIDGLNSHAGQMSLIDEAGAPEDMIYKPKYSISHEDFLETYRAAMPQQQASKSSDSQKSSMTAGSFGDKGRFITLDSGQAIFIKTDGTVDQDSGGSSGRDPVPSFGKKKRANNKADEELEKTISDTVGSNPKTVKEFRGFVDDAHELRMSEYSEELDDFQQLLGFYGIKGPKVGGFISGLKRSTGDYSTVKAFDELARTAREENPRILASRRGASDKAGDDENALWNKLRAGFPERPVKNSAETMQMAKELWESSRSSKAKKKLRPDTVGGAVLVNPDDPFSEYVPFSAYRSSSNEQYEAIGDAAKQSFLDELAGV